MKTSKSASPEKSTDTSPTVFQPQNEPFFKPAVLQPKLKIGKPADKYEKEADRVANAVMRMPDSAVQRQPMEEEEELQMQRGSTIQLKCAECEEEHLQTKVDGTTAGSGQSFAGPKLSNLIRSKLGKGSRLSGAVQSEMGTKIGADFSSVNIHTDSEAVQMNRELGAKAFTHGNDIFFNSDQYNPSSPQGKRLLAHELTHVVQQEGHFVPSIQRQEKSADDSQKQNKIDIGKITDDFFQWAAKNYIIPRDKYLKSSGNWAKMGPTHKADEQVPKNFDDAIIGAYAEVGQNPSMKAIKWGATAMGIGITIMVGVEIYATWAAASATTKILLGTKGTTRILSHSAPVLDSYFGKESKKVSVDVGDATKHQMGFFLIYIAGDKDVQKRFLKENYSDLPDEVKDVIIKLISKTSDTMLNNLGTKNE